MQPWCWHCSLRPRAVLPVALCTSFLFLRGRSRASSSRFPMSRTGSSRCPSSSRCRQGGSAALLLCLSSRQLRACVETFPEGPRLLVSLVRPPVGREAAPSRGWVVFGLCVFARCHEHRVSWGWSCPGSLAGTRLKQQKDTRRRLSWAQLGAVQIQTPSLLVLAPETPQEKDERP